ncbi:MAG: hypothetical protein FJX72_16805 [Armatimonadetes bacterium]|nr:hypothetical protein [Armatimonadota bacterium]
MTALLLGDYHDGVVTLQEKPLGVREGRVRVLLVAATGDQPESCTLVYGKYRGQRMSEPEDYVEAEWRGREGLGD